MLKRGCLGANLGLFCSPVIKVTAFPLVRKMPWEGHMKEWHYKFHVNTSIHAVIKTEVLSALFFFLHLPLSTSELHHRTLSVLPFPHYTSVQGPSNEWHKNTFVLGTKRKGYVKPESISEALEMSPAESKMNFLNHILLSSSNKISRLWTNFKSCLIVCTSQKNAVIQ